MTTERIDCGQVREAIKTDCRGWHWWRCLVEDILNELTMTRWRESELLRKSESLGLENSQGCDEITRLRNWIRHWRENGWVEDELQMALDGEPSPLCSPAPPTAPKEEDVWSEEGGDDGRD